MNRTPRALSGTIARNKSWPDETSLKRRLLFAVLVLVTACVASIGLLRLVQSLNEGTIGIWRIILLLAIAFSCVTIVCALYARGREPRHTHKVGRERR